MSRNDKDFLVEKIRSQYTEKEHTELDSLRELDAKVKRPANTFAYIFGIVGSLIMGAGMSLTMDVIEPETYFGITIPENMMLYGIIIGVIGIFIVSINYPVYKKLLASRKKKYAPKIIELSKKIAGE